MPVSPAPLIEGVNISGLPKVSISSPMWASAYHTYANSVPEHRGKPRVLKALLNIGLKQQKPFLWKMQNQSLISISPLEALMPNGVGWTCYTEGIWEPHVENALRQIIQPGNTVLDIGANIGYFSAVMAQCTGPNGKVFSFEPVPTTFQQLIDGMAANGFHNLTALPVALGAESGELTMNHDPKFPGGDSLYQWNSDWKADNTIQITVRQLDTLIADNIVAAPDVIKIDIEGHELNALTGARQTLTQFKPTIIMEFNKNLANLAGWTLPEMNELLRSCGYNHFYLLNKQMQAVAMDAKTQAVAEDEYIDILVSAREVSLRN